MRVALLIGILMIDMLGGIYDLGWSGDSIAIVDDGGQVQAYEDPWPPPPPPPSFP